mmetsp:Transcript_23735/g.70426  ORF Transcript_23735/g.70426 Transcript_23735/m.70426 type:complete len:86 (+) Transcript_23735:2453-2710(+)|eukprot:365483-Chlamydomonas_euryale.AAC.2
MAPLAYALEAPEMTPSTLINPPQERLLHWMWLKKQAACLLDQKTPSTYLLIAQAAGPSCCNLDIPGTWVLFVFVGRMLENEVCIP